MAEEQMDVDMDEQAPRLRSTVNMAHGRSMKGRGTAQGNERMTGHFEGIREEAADDGTHVQKSIDGFVLFVTGLHEESSVEDLNEIFAEAGDVLNLWLNLDRQTGYVKGYCLVEYRTREEAASAIEQFNKTEYMGKNISVGWAFIKPPPGRSRRR